MQDLFIYTNYNGRFDLVLNKCLSGKCLFHVKQKGRKVQNKLSFFYE